MFLKNHDFIHVNSIVAGKYDKHKQDGGYLRFPIRTILATADLQVTSILPMNFESIALLVPEKKFKIDFQDFGIFYQNDLSNFPSTSPNPMLPTKFWVNWPFSSGEAAKKINFQDGHHLGFLIRMILAIFDLQIILILPTNFRVNPHFGSGKEMKKRVSRWRPSWISDPNDFSYF